MKLSLPILIETRSDGKVCFTDPYFSCADEVGYLYEIPGISEVEFAGHLQVIECLRTPLLLEVCSINYPTKERNKSEDY